MLTICIEDIEINENNLRLEELLKNATGKNYDDMPIQTLGEIIKMLFEEIITLQDKVFKLENKEE